MPLLVMGIGIPGAGKSTILKTVANDLGMTYVSDDEVILHMANSTNAPIEEIFEEMRKIIATGLASGNDVVFDSTNTSREVRMALIEFIRQQNIEADIVACTFDIPLENAIERNNERKARGGHSIPAKIITRCFDDLKENPPTLAEGYTRIVTIDASGHLHIDAEKREITREIKDLRGY
jgi:predicted kinase